MREATYTGTAAFPSDAFAVTNCLNRNVHLTGWIHIWTFLIQSWRSVVLKNIKPEINRPKSCKTQLPKYIQSDHDYDATEQKRRPEQRAPLLCSTRFPVADFKRRATRMIGGPSADLRPP